MTASDCRQPMLVHHHQVTPVQLSRPCNFQASSKQSSFRARSFHAAESKLDGLHHTNALDREGDTQRACYSAAQDRSSLLTIHTELNWVNSSSVKHHLQTLGYTWLDGLLHAELHRIECRPCSRSALHRVYAFSKTVRNYFILASHAAAGRTQGSEAHVFGGHPSIWFSRSLKGLYCA